MAHEVIGVAQICEAGLKLRGEVGKRQAEGARIGPCENGGGNIGVEEASMVSALLQDRGSSPQDFRNSP